MEHFRGMQENGLERAMELDCSYFVEGKADLTLKMQMVMEFDRFPIFSGIGGQVEWKSEALELCPRLC